jgi:4-amino-4-deoxy-L-arabinose transferase-like glycosyltransferase
MTLVDTLWGRRARFAYLLFATLIMLFTALGARDIWTQEHRWADIVFGMFYRHDFLHPYLGQTRYYDKPLLSYWLIVICSKLWGQLNIWTLRIPSALSGVLAIWSIYQLGTQLKNKNLGMLAGWMLLTTFYFVFWARTSSADMMNMAGSLFAVAWYYAKRDKATFFDFAIFFIILALTSLCKGLGGAIVPLIAVFVDVCLRRSWLTYLRLPVFLSIIPGMLIYLAPFMASSWFGGDQFGQNGLYLVYRENILRYFQPFDHKGPIYTYFIYLPVYMLPWSLLFIPALATLKQRWSQLSINSKWCAWTLLALFLFFSLSGSRRSYYVLPMVPFAILFTADWLLSYTNEKKINISSKIVLITFILLFFAIDILPAWYYTNYGVSRFAAELKAHAARVSPQPWKQWQVIMLDGDTKLNFYLELPPDSKYYGNKQLKQWPLLKDLPANTIFISRKSHADKLQPYFVNYDTIVLNASSKIDSPIAFVPRESIR